MPATLGYFRITAINAAMEYETALSHHNDALRTKSCEPVVIGLGNRAWLRVLTKVLVSRK
jgi:hypothetical protein